MICIVYIYMKYDKKYIAFLLLGRIVVQLRQSLSTNMRRIIQRDNEV